MKASERWEIARARLVELEKQHNGAIIEEREARLALALEMNGILSAATPRERQVLECVVKGMQNKEICGELHISISMVKAHVHSLLRKARVTNRNELVVRERA